MSRKVKRVLTYIFAPIIMTILGYGLLYLAGRPVINLVTSVASMVFTKSTPNFSEELNSIFDANTVKAQDKVNNSEVKLPANETHYGYIECERVDLSAPLYFGDTDKVLKNGVGQSMSSFIPGNGKPILIGGHDSTYFAPLEFVEKGDIIKITTSYGNYEYKVTKTEVTDANGTNAYDLSQQKEELILYTCYPFGVVVGVKQQRFFVYADKISGPSIVMEE